MLEWDIPLAGFTPNIFLLFFKKIGRAARVTLGGKSGDLRRVAKIRRVQPVPVSSLKFIIINK